VLFSPLLFASPILAQAPAPTPTPQEIVVPRQVRPLPGQLDDTLQFNSNSPELVGSEGILLSTFPPAGKQHPAAHLDVALAGRFDVFAHHVFRAVSPDNLTSLYLGIVLHNPGTQPVTVQVTSAASYLSQPDAPFIALPGWVENADGSVFAGPGSRAMSDVLRGRRSDAFPDRLVIPPGEYRLLLNAPIPVATLDPPLNGRSTLARLRSDGPVYAASLALFARRDANGEEQAPTLADWVNLLETGDVATPRDRPPSPPGEPGAVIYGRVAGVARGSRWAARITDEPDGPHLSIPPAGMGISYPLSSLVAGRLGTGQIQTAPLIVRYDDTAYAAHGNYAVEYDLALPLHNPTDRLQRVAIALQTPIKEDTLSQNGLRFFDPLPTQTFFRGTVRVRYFDSRGLNRTRYVHLVQRRGDRSAPLAVLDLPPGGRRLARVTFLYPPDATPPQVLTLQTLSD